MLTFTCRAADKIVEIAREQCIEKLTLRAKVMGGGCAGFSYDIAFEELEPSDLDEVFDCHAGVKLFVDPMSLQYLDGTEIDYVIDSNMGEGFKFMNPNSKGSCGCGSSFSA